MGAAPPAAKRAGAELPSTVTGVLPYSAIALAVAVALAGVSAQAADVEGKAPKEAAPSAPYPVFIPVDGRQRPTGGKYYVPEPFYDQLYRRASAAAEKPQGWLLTAAEYRGSLSKDPMSGQLALDELTVRFELSVFGRATRVRIPFRRDEARLLPDGSLLDGRPVQPEWETDGGALVVDVPEPGQYRLDFAVQPVARGPAAAVGFDLAIPRLVTARLELALPGDLPAVEAASALGAVRREKQPPRLVAELGPADRLTVHWPDASGATGAAATIDAEELFWLKVLPGSVIIDARLKLKAAAGQIRRVQLATDPSLQLLPLPGAEPAVQVRPQAGQAQIVEFRWARPMESTTVDARFLLVGASSVGNLRLPQLDVLDVRPTKRWLAVSVDPALEHEAEAASPADAVAVPDFLG